MKIDYTKYDQQSIHEELISYLKETTTFRNVDVKGTTFNELINLIGYNASLFGFYANQIANEPFLDAAKLYKNLNRIANNLRYKPRGKGSAIVPVLAKLSKEYTLANNEGFIEVPSYSTFPVNGTTNTGQNFSFTNTKPLIIPVNQFGVSFLKGSHLRYSGEISQSGNLSSDRLSLLATEKNPVTVLDENGNIIGELGSSIYSSPSETLADFEVDTVYSLVIRQDNSGNFQLIIYPETTTVLTDEIAKFKVNEDRTITITKNYSLNRLYKGRLGIRNLEYVNFEAIPVFGNDRFLSKLQMVIPRFSPTVDFLINGEVYSFSSTEEDIVISTDDIPSGSFNLVEDINIVLTIGDENSINYGAFLELKTDAQLADTDVVVARLPINSDTVENGNLKILENEFLKGETKQGVVEFDGSETVKRVIFSEPFDIGDGSTTSISESSDKNYAITLSADGNVTTFFSDKRTNGFNLNIEDDTGFSGKVTWKAVGYERVRVQEETQDLTSFQSSFNVTEDYSVMVQASSNINLWVSDTTPSGFKVSSDVSFTGDVDFLIVPDSDLENSGDFSVAGSVFAPKSETEIEVIFTKSRPTADYRVFLQPNGNVKTWVLNKTTEGFIIRVEPNTDFFGKIDWQIHEGALSGTLRFVGSNIVSGVPEIEYVDIPETVSLGEVEQGTANLTVIDKNGVIATNNNSLNLEYNTDIVIYPGLSFVVGNQNISFNNIRVFVKIEDTWTEFTNSDIYGSDIGPTSKVFHVRVNKDKKIGITFGDNDNRGFNPENNEIAIIGLDCVGEEGNIAQGILANTIISSLNFDTRNNTPLAVEEALIDLIKVKREMYFNNTSFSSLIDYQDNSVTVQDLTIVQMGPGVFGTELESVEELRLNSQYSYHSQDRMVSKSDYKTLISKEFSDIVVDVEVFNFKQAKESGLLPSDSSIFNANTLFFLAIPAIGTRFTISQKKLIEDFIEDRTKKHATTGSVVIEPTFVPIDVIASYDSKVNFSFLDSKNAINTGVKDFFRRENRRLGEIITIDAIRNNIDLESINNLSIQLNKDPNNDYTNVDYDVDITSDQYTDAFKEVQDRKLNSAINTELRNLLGKNLIQINQPLFDVQNPDGSRDWIYTGEVTLGRFEFPILGDVVLERRV
jgi:hypothetical protein